MQNQEMLPLHTIYKGGFFKNRHKMIWRVPIFCDAIMSIFNPKSVIDIGCAIGDFVRGFEDRDVYAFGIEGSEACVPFMQTRNYNICDLRENLFFDERYDLCMCLEMAEHVEPEYADMLIKNLCKLSNNLLISMAPPGQKGHHHVNCQYINYWDDKFEKQDYVRNDFMSDKIRELIEPYKRKPGLKAYYDNLHFYKGLNCG